MQREFALAVYILASSKNGTLYIGVTSVLPGRLHQHRTGSRPGFTNKYGVYRLAWKLRLIEDANPDWHDLAEEFGFEALLQPGFPPARK